jgi:hypothetical protein
MLLYAVAVVKQGNKVHESNSGISWLFPVHAKSLAVMFKVAQQRDYDM